VAGLHRRWVIVGLGLSLVVGCRGRGEVGDGGGGHGEGDAVGVSEGAGAAADAWVISVLPTSSGSRLIVGIGASVRVLEGRRRLASGGGVVEDLPGAPFVGFAGAVEGTTAFVDAGGSLYRSPSFTGTLSALPADGKHYTHVAATSDTAFVCAKDGTLARFALSGAPQLRTLEQRCATGMFQPLLAVGDTVFVADPTRRLMRSTDGTRFSAVDIGNRTIVDFAMLGTSAQTTAGDLELRADGTVAVQVPDPDATSSLYLSADVEQALRDLEAEYGRRYPDISSASRAYRAGDAGFLVCGYDSCLALGSEQPGARPGGACITKILGPTPVAVCGGHSDGAMSIHQLRAGVWHERARLPMREGGSPGYHDNPEIVAWTADEQGRVVLDVECPAPSDELGMGSDMCWFDGERLVPVDIKATTGTDARSRPFMAGPAFVTLAGPFLVRAEGEGALRRIDLRDGTGEWLEHGRAAAWPDNLVFRGDVLLAAVETNGKLEVIAQRDTELRHLPVPDGARSIGFASAERFMAVGTHANAVWTTTDGAKTWTKQAIPVDGDPARVEVEAVTCSTAGCTAAPVAWIDRQLFEQYDYRAPKLVAPPRVSPRAAR
jgi:hypothetical protein